jgi:type IV fimbrial biogenesis protein FimT
MLIARDRGFTLIELMIGVALLGLLMMLAFPSFTTMMHNARLRAVAESIQSGLQSARAEALKRNQTAEFLLMVEVPDDGTFTTFNANTTGPSWAVRILDTAGLPVAFVEGRNGLEASGQSDPSQLYARISAGNLPAGSAIRFDSLGRTNVGVVNTTFDVQPSDANACRANGGDRRCLRVVVTPGGRVRMCDPSIDPVANPTDTRIC